MKDIKIGNIKMYPLILAPMAGLTDLPFRCICKKYGARLTCSEMVSSRGMHYDSDKTKDLLERGDDEDIFSVQIFGSSPEIMGEITKTLDDYPCDIIDINMGCPATKIIKNGDGSALMKNPKLVGEIVKSVVNNTKKPVTVKIRKGYNNSMINAVEIAKIIEANGASAVTVHGRTKEQLYSGVVDYSIIRDVKNAVKIPVIGNGDIIDPLSAQKMLDETGCDGIMIGRGTMGNPFIFRNIENYLKNGEFTPKPSLDEIIETALYHTRQHIAYKGDFIGMREMRKHLSWYVKGIRGSNKIKVELNKATTFEEAKSLLDTL